MADLQVPPGYSYSYSNLVQDKYVGLFLAMVGNTMIGCSFIITKKGLIAAGSRGNQRQQGPVKTADYMQNPVWWTGMITMVIGEVANFAAYAFAPPVLVTPLGALSVLIGAVLASVFLKEELGRIGRVGCALCLLGSLVIVLHAPEDKDVQNIDEILGYCTNPGFVLYSLFVTVYSLYMIYRVAPIYGTKNPLVYLSICSLVGSISVMAIKGLGVALKLTFAGNNQLNHLPTYVFAIVVGGCIAIQMNYFNKALDTFSTNVVNPIYYVFFSSATIIASLLLFQGLNTSGGVNTISLICGFLTTFLGVYLLNLSRSISSGDDAVDDGPNSNSARNSTHHHRRRVSQHGFLETGILNPRISISDDIRDGSDGLRVGGGHGDMSEDEEESYPLRSHNGGNNKNHRKAQHSMDSHNMRDPQKRNSIQSYNHQASSQISSPINADSQYAAVASTDTDRHAHGHHSLNRIVSPSSRRSPGLGAQRIHSPGLNQTVFDIGMDEEEDHNRGYDRR